MKYHILTGEVRMQVEAPSLEAAFIMTLRVADLEKCNQFICGFEHGKKFEDPGTRFGLVEWYLDRAGYRSIGDHLWKKESTTDTPSNGNSGLSQKKADAVQTSTPSLEESTSKTGSPVHSTRDGKRQPHKMKSVKRVLSERIVIPTKRPVKVVMQRTPEEWAELVRQAKTNVRAT